MRNVNVNVKIDDLLLMLTYKFILILTLISLLMFIMFSKEIVQNQFLPQGQAINHFYYLKVLNLLLENIRKMRPELWCNLNWRRTTTMLPAICYLLLLH